MNKSASLLILLILLSSINALPQTRKVEAEKMSKSYQNGGISQSEYLEIGKKWNVMLDEIGGYPELPYNAETGIVQYEFVKSFIGIDKKTIYNRIKEWAAVNFGRLDAVLHYENLETGKIVIKGSFELPVLYDYKTFWGKEKEDSREGTCFQTYIFTIKDEKLKIQITNLSYEVRMSYYSSSTNSYTKATTKLSIYEVCPVILKDPLRWKEYLTMIKFTSTEIIIFVNRLESYLNSFEQDYKF